MTVPKMMFASSCAASCTSEAASLISNRPRSLPPAMDSSTPCAPSIDASSSGELIALPAACTARPSPRAEPMPISAVPAPAITDFTSAKSTLIRPGVVIRSVMPWTPLSSTSSADRNASISETPRSPSCSSRSLGMTIRVSHSLRSCWMPSSAWPPRRLPSKANGRVTTPMVSAPSLRAMDATTGAPPVPVPPPSPAVTKTMSAPLSTSSISSRWSSAALRPTSGLAPAPRPRVSSRPTSSLTSASRHQQGLGVGVDRDELDPAQADLDHPVDRVDAAAADADDLDDGEVVVRWRHRVSPLLVRLLGAVGSAVPNRSCAA